MDIDQDYPLSDESDSDAESDSDVSEDYIFKLVEEGRYEELKKELKNDANPNSTKYDCSMQTLIFFCDTEKGNLACLILLLQYGADPNISDDDYMTPLAYAVDNDDQELIKILVLHGADYNFVYPDEGEDKMISEHPNWRGIDYYTDPVFETKGSSDE